MRYLACLYLFCCYNLQLLGQSPVQFQLETRSGYQYNAFNSSPKKFLTNNGVGLQSGYFQQFAYRLSWEKEIKRHSLKIKTAGRYNFFPDIKMARRFRSDASVNYTVQLKSRLAWFAKGSFLLLQTQSPANATEVVNIPAAYYSLKFLTGIQFQRTKQQRVRAEVWQQRKQYAIQNDRRLHYQAIGAQVKFRQRIKRSGKPTAFLSALAGWSRRTYFTRSRFMEQESEEEDAFEFWETENNRIWQYLQLKLDYTFKTGKRLKWQTGINWQQRLDQLEEQFGYRQLEGFVALNLKHKKWEGKAKIAGVRRAFTDLAADTEEAFLLQHHYLRFSYQTEYTLNDHWVLVGQLNFKKRWRNFPPQTRLNYLPYTTGQVSFGIKYKF